ncbi:oligosaccharide flippase family protein [Desulfopila inferna]|uniref:oligosaccharide flippase family protein n=1 Tax=Desulfopila inferna TaxID=468528 RepID=UPI0019635DD3|nr:oligosaccharide flippase family protein [Desulfopila inferna]MBM9605763.1 oligosaccharide flippase family protein [Desulfopila inferna]
MSTEPAIPIVKVTLSGEASTPTHAKHSLRKHAIHGSFWTLVNFAFSRLLRLGGNLILTRMLFPEAFGVMALVNVVIHSLEMFSDLGIGAALIRDPRGEDPRFFNTAWTIAVLRGLLLWLVSVAICFPAAHLFEIPSLVQFIPVAALSAVLTGLTSPAVYILRRRVELRPLMIWELSSQSLGLISIILIAYFFPSVWALVIGNVIRSFVACSSSYRLLSGLSVRFEWNSRVAREVIRFGKWLFLSTAITALIREGDKAILGININMNDLGLYALATFWANNVIIMLTQINSKVLFPLYSQVANQDENQLRQKVFRARLALMALSLPPLWMLAIGGQLFIELLYDPRYLNSGWMLQLLAVSAIAQTLGMGSLNAVLAKGDSFACMVVQTARAGLVIICMLMGWFIAGLAGLIGGIAIGNLLVYPVLTWAISRHKLWLPQIDLLIIGSSAVIICIGLTFIR